jgi:AraC-like DNA-binding protein
MTVSGWVLDRRLGACKQALTDPAYNRQRISEIAFRWGFNSTSHFCRAFKEKYGAAPGDVRRTAGTS